MFNKESLEYIGIVSTGVILITAWSMYKKGKLSKDYKEQEVPYEKLSNFGKWWKNSYIREIYVVRASQRKALCALPWIGVVASVIAIYASIVWIYAGVTRPTQPLQNLIKYDGIFLEFKKYRKSSDIAVFKSKNGEIKYFASLIGGSQEWQGKKMSIWAQKDWSPFSGKYETAVWKEFDYKPMNYEAFMKSQKRSKEIDNMGFRYLPISLLSLFCFLVLLWFINRNPVKMNQQEKNLNSEDEALNYFNNMNKR